MRCCVTSGLSLWDLQLLSLFLETMLFDSYVERRCLNHNVDSQTHKTLSTEWGHMGISSYGQLQSYQRSKPILGLKCYQLSTAWIASGDCVLSSPECLCMLGFPSSWRWQLSSPCSFTAGQAPKLNLGKDSTPYAELRSGLPVAWVLTWTFFSFDIIWEFHVWI